MLSRARRELAAYYPTYADFQPMTPEVDFKAQPMRLLDTDENGVPFSLAGRLTRSARRLTLHLPQCWPWETQFSRALARLRAIPLPA